jgi:hypothetical protein
MKHDVLVAVKMSLVVFWVMVLCGVVSGLNAQFHMASQPKTSPLAWRKDFTHVHLKIQSVIERLNFND